MSPVMSDMLRLPKGVRPFDVAIGLVALGFILRVWYQKQRSAKLPPGPKGLPLVGNLYDLPKKGDVEWFFWAKHKDLYGPISSVKVFGQTIVLLNERQAAVDLLENRSLVYSDRPVMVFGGNMCGWRDLVALEPYGARLQTKRKHMHKLIGTPKAMERFQDRIMLGSRRLMFKISRNPDALLDHIKAMARSTILGIAYGYGVDQTAKDPLIKLADEAMRQVNETLIPGRWLVDTVPALQHIPDWFPGARFKRIAGYYMQTFTDLKDWPHEFVKKQMDEGVAPHSFTADSIEQFDGENSEEYESMIKQVAVTLFSGGSDTTVSAMYSFMLAMTLYPDIQKKAQAEIDAVVGSQRLPTFADRPNLPYLRAIMKETHRWNPVAPLAFAHMTSEDDIYQGYHIPKGALVLPNIWNYTQNPDEYPDPRTFNPERFISGSKGQGPERDPEEVIFGFGRRICPGQDMANDTVFITLATALATFNFLPPRDASGREVKPSGEYTSGLISGPKEFKCLIVPRSEKASALIAAVGEEHPLDAGDAKEILTVGRGHKYVGI